MVHERCCPEEGTEVCMECAGAEQEELAWWRNEVLRLEEAAASERMQCVECEWEEGDGGAGVGVSEEERAEEEAAQEEAMQQATGDEGWEAEMELEMELEREVGVGA